METPPAPKKSARSRSRPRFVGAISFRRIPQRLQRAWHGIQRGAEYTPGDDIRSIDWNVTARFGHPYVKVFEEERELTVILLVDERLRRLRHEATVQTPIDDGALRGARLLRHSEQRQDRRHFFSDRVEKFIPPKKGKTHILRIIRELIEFKPVNRKTDLAVALAVPHECDQETQYLFPDLRFLANGEFL